MLKTEKVKTHVMFPSELLRAIDEVVGSRKRSSFIVEAAKEKLEEIRFRKALEAAAGCWKDENHPDLRTQEDIRRFLKMARESTAKRMKQFSG